MKVRQEMANGHVCCILAVCCPPGSAAQREALETMIQKAHPTMPEARVKSAASRVLKAHDDFKNVPTILKEFAA